MLWCISVHSRGENNNLDKVNSTLVAFQGLQDLAQRLLQSSHLKKSLIKLLSLLSPVVPLKCWGNDPFAWGSHRGVATEYRKTLRNLFWLQKQNPFDKHCTFSPQTPIQNFIFNQRLFCRTLKESRRIQNLLVVYLFVCTVKKYIILPVWRITR